MAKITEKIDLYKAIFNNANDAIFIHGLEGSFIDVNETACKRLGYSKEELLKLSPKDIDSAEFAEQVDEKIHALYSNGKMVFETIHITKDGKRIPTELSSRIINYRGKKVIMSIARDITRRKKIETDLLKRHHALENSLIAIVIADLEGYITYVNPSFLDMWGYSSKDEVIGRNSIDFWSGNDPINIIRNVRKKGKWQGKLNAKRKDGTDFNVQISASMVLDKDGNRKSMLAWFLDFTEKERMLNDLIQAERRYKLLFETMTQGVVYHDSEGKIILANPAAEKILGKRLGEIINKSSHSPIWKTIHEDASKFRGNKHPAIVSLRTGEPVYNTKMGIYNTQKEEYRWINVNAIPLFHKGLDKPHQVYSIFEDITAQKKAQEELRKNRERLEGILNALTEMVFMINNKHKILWANKIVKLLFGSDTIGKICYKTFYQLDKPYAMYHRANFKGWKSPRN
ncbi:MAG: PAS domain S-box protein [Candidatus Lokiarchaeota archaeon]|nr:PAS domain S-box protein [Candidatus Lokiarchaeota archaeon]